MKSILADPAKLVFYIEPRTKNGPITTPKSAFLSFFGRKGWPGSSVLACCIVCKTEQRRASVLFTAMHGGSFAKKGSLGLSTFSVRHFQAQNLQIKIRK